MFGNVRGAWKITFDLLNDSVWLMTEDHFSMDLTD